MREDIRHKPYTWIFRLARLTNVGSQSWQAMQTKTFIFVGCNTVEIEVGRLRFFTIIQSIREFTHGLFYIVLQDFNEIQYDSEKLGEVSNNWSYVAAFRKVLKECRLEDIGFFGTKFMWSNKRDGKDMIMEWVNRAWRLGRNSDNMAVVLYMIESCRKHLDSWTKKCRRCLREDIRRKIKVLGKTCMVEQPGSWKVLDDYVKALGQVLNFEKSLICVSQSVFDLENARLAAIVGVRMMAEAVAIYKGLQFAIDIGLNSVVLESNTTIVVKWIKDGSHLDSVVGVLMSDILDMISTLICKIKLKVNPKKLTLKLNPTIIPNNRKYPIAGDHPQPKPKKKPIHHNSQYPMMRDGKKKREEKEKELGGRDLPPTSRPLYLEPATRLTPVLVAATGDLRRPAVGTSTSGQQQILRLHSFVYASSDMGSTDLTGYVAFEEKVRRTVYLDNLSPLVTESVLRNGLNQFGTVKSCQFIQNYTELKNIPLCALVEMGNVKQAKAVVAALGEFPFMMSGMPRPVRARLAEVEMFDDRPKKPGRKRHCCWLNPNGPDFEVAQKLKQLVRKHAAEASFLLKKQLQEEEKLEKHQEDSLKANYKKYELIEGIMGDGSAKRLAQQYESPHHFKYGVSINVALIDCPRRRQKCDDHAEKFYCAVSKDVVGDASRSAKKSQEIVVEDFGFQNLNSPFDVCPSSTERDRGDFVDHVDLPTNNDSFVPKRKETFLTFSDVIKSGAHHSQVALWSRNKPNVRGLKE
ncbi:hypothetical protein Dsin_018477 [Dipteronia sinensis]|uniref:RRM domain-containing protein n=1 Tax=Dipteronia sinensis TaxID=43782 RepID=A0AAE0E238_9ROSI|nr:hypothetical protein Dsin_018477 [Dipteronia sinensis]